MSPIRSEHDFQHLVDVMGNMPFVRRYIVLCLCFELSDPTQNVIDSALRLPLQRLGDAFPYLAGRVVIEGLRKGNSGICKVVPYHSSVPLEVKDLSHNPATATFQGLKAAKYPFSLLDSNQLAPRSASTWDQDPGSDKVAPVLILQANLIKGGLILTFSGNHTIMDMTGLGLVIGLFAKACRGELFSNEDLERGNQAKGAAVPLLDGYQRGPELDDVFINSSGPSLRSDASPRWVYWNISAASLGRLKDEASRHMSVAYISTDDAVAALAWQAITRARQNRLGAGVRSYFARPCSMRKYLGLQGYIGHMVDTLYEEEVDVWKLPLGEVASSLRRMLQREEQIKHHVRAVATMLDRLEDKSVIINGSQLDPNRDVVLSSYANIRCCELSFGALLGIPDAARRPRMPVWPSLCYLMPKSKDGDMAIAICLDEDDLSLMCKDSIVNEYASYIG
ncbi:hypothetical protein CAC42_888 [Sphaceloma murrayae]|uniref:Trichothecene 3-O-acetyltransferase-like N-terminal domain-containing protein n=1 Tax=Sphaceloma murrayae TaxID=2082308 RepID=A0A2K1R2M3_9PEZI|nr:hypothetical protein CAC42_888 [Sphaceloma murrayae]